MDPYFCCLWDITSKYIYSVLIQNTPILLAAKKGHSKVVKLLLEDAVDVSIPNEEGHNCLIEAILSGHR